MTREQLAAILLQMENDADVISLDLEMAVDFQMADVFDPNNLGIVLSWVNDDGLEFEESFSENELLKAEIINNCICVESEGDQHDHTHLIRLWVRTPLAIKL